MPPRAIWSGSISFGLVNVPVRMYSAISETDLRFHLIHEPDGGRIGYQKICKKEGEPVPDDEIVKGFEVEEDEFVVLADEDFEAAKAEGVKTIEIADFVPYEEIDPIYFEKTYFLGPQSGGEKVYSLLREAMERTELAGIAKFVMRDRQHLGCLRVREGTLTLEKMFFHDEVRPTDEIKPRKAKVSKSELGMATSLIEQFTSSFEPEKYKDTYREALLGIVRAKRQGKTVTAPEPETEEEPADLMAALRASIDAAKGRAQSKSTTRNGRPARRATASKAPRKTASAKSKTSAKSSSGSKKKSASKR
jgi:DNA end-binding protein Ku